MLKLLTVIVFAWLFFKTIGMTLKLTWGAAKIIASILMAFALPLLIVCLIFVGGMALLVPLAVICLAAGILKVCVEA